MTAVNLTAVSLPVFNGEGYDFWCIKFRTAMRGLDLWEVIDKGLQTKETESPEVTSSKDICETPIAISSREMARKDGEALSRIFNSVGENVFPRIMNAGSAQEAWGILQKEYAGSKQDRILKLQQLRREFENLHMNDTQTLQEYSTKLFELSNQMQALGGEISSQRIVEKLLVSLPEKFDSTVSIIEQTRNLETLTPLEVISTLKSQEFRATTRHGTSHEGALLVHSNKSIAGYKRNYKADGPAAKDMTKRTFPPCKICGRTNHLDKNCWQKGKIKCFHCKKLGHKEVDCRIKRGKAKVEQPEQEVQQLNLSLREERLLAVRQQESEPKSSLWLIDSGCTSHISNSKNFFKTLNSKVSTKVKLADGKFVEAKGRGTVSVNTRAGDRELKEVLYVPNIDYNLVSVPQLLEDRYVLHFEKKRCEITDDKGVLVADIPMNNKTFEISWSGGDELALAGQETHKAEIWHRRFGHCNMQALINMSKQSLVRDLPQLQSADQLCEPCQLGKMSRPSFPSNAEWRASERLELVHIDVCGPMQVPSLTGSRFFVLFVDDATRWTWIRFVKNKSDAFRMLMEVKSEAEGESGQKIKCLRTDNGGEFTSKQFNVFCVKNKIKRQYSAPYTPQQNGVVERKNRSVMEKTRAMLQDSLLPIEFWAEAANTAVYLMNRTTTRAVKDSTPYQAWYGVSPTAKHLRIFGCLCYVKVHDSQRHKLEPKAFAGIFIGFSHTAKAYRVYNPLTKSVIISRDIVFDEQCRFDWNTVEKRQKLTEGLDTTHVITSRIMETGDTSMSGEIVSPRAVRGDTSSQAKTPENRLPDQYEGTSSPESTPAPRGLQYLSSIYQRAQEVELVNVGVDIDDPLTFEEAVKNEKWRAAMQQEMSMIEKNNTWVVTDLPAGKKAIGVKWVYKTKLNSDGSINKHKARLVAKGYVQEYGVDYEETFAPVSRLETVRLILALAAAKRWNVYQLDVKSAFLNGELQEEVFIEQPKGFKILNQPDKVLRLQKALYGLKQAPRAWYDKIDTYLLNIGFSRSSNEHTLYLKKSDDRLEVLVSIYVDDLIVTGGSEKKIDEFKTNMKHEFDMSDLGLLHHFLGLQIVQKENVIVVHQASYAKKLLEKFGMTDCNPVTIPIQTNSKFTKEDESKEANVSEYQSMIGSLLYLCHTRPDIVYCTSMLSRFMQAPTQTHLTAVKRVIRYVKGSLDYGLIYSKGIEFRVHGYSDSDFAGSIDDSRSTSGVLFMVGDSAITWSSKKQELVAQSTAESEYMACCSAVNQAKWLRKLLADMCEEQTGPMQISCDNKSAIAIAKNPVYHKRTKHISLRYHVVRESEARGEVQIVFCAGEDQLADFLTKAVPISKLKSTGSRISLTRFSIKEEFVDYDTKPSKHEQQE